MDFQTISGVRVNLSCLPVAAGVRVTHFIPLCLRAGWGGEDDEMFKRVVKVSPFCGIHSTSDI